MRETLAIARECREVLAGSTTRNHLLVDLVASFGFHPEPAASGPEALALFDRGSYDIVLTDLLMPGMGGWEMAVS